MSKPRAQTIQQRFGFADGDLKTPKHDEIMVWLDANLDSIIKSVYRWEPITEGVVKRVRAEAAAKIMSYREHMEQILKQRESDLEARRAAYEQRKSLFIEKLEANQPMPIPSRSVLESKDLYFPISPPRAPNRSTDQIKDIERATRYEGREVERAQESVNMAAQELESALDWCTLGPVPDYEYHEFSRVWEHTVISRSYSSKYVVGFIDLLARGILYTLGIAGELPCWERVRFDDYKICFEIKSAIPSLGELIRQIRMYQEYEDGQYVVVCPDDRFAESLKAQGIGFLKYEPDRYKNS